MLMADRFREQAAACAGLGSPMYDELLKRVAADIDEGGASTDVLAGHEDDPGSSALALRLAGSVHRLVLDGRAPELAAFYPSAGGCWELRPGWAAFDGVLRDQPEQVRGLLGHPPQTNEVGRAAALMGGLLLVGESHRLPVRLLEIGSSGGLNLRADQFCYQGFGGWRCGRNQGPVRLESAWEGRRLDPWDQLEVVERIGSDVSPVDVSTAEGRLTLASYVWPDQITRAERLRNAFTVATELPVRVRRQDAVSFVGEVGLVEGRRPCCGTRSCGSTCPPRTKSRSPPEWQSSAQARVSRRRSRTCSSSPPVVRRAHRESSSSCSTCGHRVSVACWALLWRMDFPRRGSKSLDGALPGVRGWLDDREDGGLMSAESTDGAPNDDLRAKMREALERKQHRNDPADHNVEHKTHDRGHAEAHGPAGGPKMHRRKAGGGGA